MKRLQCLSVVVLSVLLIVSGSVFASNKEETKIDEYKSGSGAYEPITKKESRKQASETKKSSSHETINTESHDTKQKPTVRKKTAKPTHGGEKNSHEHAAGLTALQSLNRLIQGNERYVSGKQNHPNQNGARRVEVARAQHPYAVIVSCSDSRVPPEILFDQGVGDLFVIRLAGNVVDDYAIGSIEYAVEHLGAKLIMVLGHKRCGAVQATLDAGPAPVPGQIAKIVDAIKPAVEKGKSRHGHDDVLTECVKQNVKGVSDKIRSAAPIISEQVNDGIVRVVGGFYDLDSGKVDIVYNPQQLSF